MVAKILRERKRGKDVCRQPALCTSQFCIHKIQPNTDQKYLEKKNHRKFQKAKLENAMRGNYLRSIYIALDMISNLEMT